jgi:hypothetical protein
LREKIQIHFFQKNNKNPMLGRISPPRDAYDWRGPPDYSNIQPGDLEGNHPVNWSDEEEEEV